MPIAGKGPFGKAPGWDPSAHQSRPEAQDERDQVGGATGRGYNIGSTPLRSAERRTKVPGFKREGKAPNGGGIEAPQKCL